MDDRDQMQLFKELTESYGAPGFEAPVREVMRKYLSKYSTEVVTDQLGSIFGVKRGKPEEPTVMVAGHMDEVAMMVTRIEENGFLRFHPLGGWWDQVMMAHRVVVHSRHGWIDGVIGTIPTHILSEEERSKPFPVSKMFVDIGATSAEEVKRMGVMPGDPIVPTGELKILNDRRLLAKSWDNRYGCALAVELMDEVSEVELPNTLYAGATVQEEVGLRGAETAARLIQPDLFFALDAGPANDMPGSKDGFGRLGEGLLLRIMDRSMITHRGLRDYLISICEEEGIPYQFFVSPGATDAGKVHLSGIGVPSAVIGIPARYIHSHVSIIDKGDYEAAKRLLTLAVKRLNRNALEKIHQGMNMQTRPE